MVLEVQAFTEWRAVLGKQAGDFLPEIYGFDKNSMVFVMEFLDSYVLMDKVRLYL